MRTLSSIVLATALLAPAGVANAQTIDAGRGQLPVTTPSSYTGDTAAPLIVLLHAFGNTGTGEDEYLRLSALADTYGFILVAPDGNPSNAPMGDNKNPLFWNASSACCNWEGHDVDDSAYLTDVIDAVKAQYRIDPTRVFLIGHSNGGFMTHRMAAEHSGRIAAIVSLAGADELAERPAPASPVHVLQIHGTGDTSIAYDGAEIQGTAYPGAIQSVENWATRNGCATTPSEAGTLDLDSGLAGMDTTVTRYTSGCRAGGSAELWTIADGQHFPTLSDQFTPLVVEWLMGHPKP